MDFVENWILLKELFDKTHRKFFSAKKIEKTANICNTDNFKQLYRILYAE